MHGAGLSRAVSVKASPARHCFISLPRPLAALIQPALIPTFILEVSQGRSIALSWAGEMHQDENDVYISHAVLRGCGISEGETGVLTQVPSPPPVTNLSVMVNTIDQWQDLTLNAEGAQSAFLSQVRVVAAKQEIPLWLDGGVCVVLRVLSLNPDLPQGVLQYMTSVEVLPPDEEKGQTSVTFTPSDTHQDPSTSSFKSTHSPISQGESMTSGAKPKDPYSALYTSVFSYLFQRLREQRIQPSLPLRKLVQFGFRVVSAGNLKISDSLMLLMSHPSLVIVSRRNIAHTAYKDESSFLARLRKVESPREAADEENKSDENRKTSNPQITCTVVIWENFISMKNIEESVKREMMTVLHGKNCIVPDSLRRLLKLSVFSIVELEAGEVETVAMPVNIKMLPLTPMDEKKAKGLCEEVKMRLRKIVDECNVVVNKDTLLTIKSEQFSSGYSVDLLLKTINKPLLLTKTSVGLLNINLLKTSPDLPHIQEVIGDLDNIFKPKHSYLGDQSVFKKLRDHILLSLRSSKGGFNSLVHGSKGSGKTSLVESLVECISSHPHFFHCEIVNFKQLRGKKAETVEKRLQGVFRQAIFHRPSLVILEDLDFLASEPEESGPANEHLLQIISILQSFLGQVAEITADQTGPPDSPVVVLATCVARTSVHPLLVNPRGHHYFPTSFPIPPLDSEGRLSALNIMLQTHLGSLQNQNVSKSRPPIVGLERQAIDRETDTKTHHEKFPLSQKNPYFTKNPSKKQAQKIQPQSIQDEQISRQSSHKVSSAQYQINIDPKAVSRRIENFVLPDLSHLALRTFLHAKLRWQKDAKTQESSRKCPLMSITQRHESSEDPIVLEETAVVTEDVEAALVGYTPLALKGVQLSDESQTTPEVGGLSEAWRTLEETLGWPARYPGIMQRVKSRLRSGVLLFGPPGTGKTLLAHAIAAACKLNFVTVKGPELLSKYIGASEAAVRDAFQRASQARPCVLFFDEFEAIGGVRGKDSTGVTDRVVNQLLTQLDGAEEVVGVSVLAATSRPDLIDPALLRPGRLDKCVLCPLPSESDRTEILRVLAKDLPMGSDVDLGKVAKQTIHFSGADLHNLLASAQVLVAQEALGEGLYEGVIEDVKIDPHEKKVSEISSIHPSQTEDENKTGKSSIHPSTTHHLSSADSDPRQNPPSYTETAVHNLASENSDTLETKTYDLGECENFGVGKSEMHNLEKEVSNFEIGNSDENSYKDVGDVESKEIVLESDNSDDSDVTWEMTGAKPKTHSGSTAQEQVVIEKQKVKYSPQKLEDNTDNNRNSNEDMDNENPQTSDNIQIREGKINENQSGERKINGKIDIPAQINGSISQIYNKKSEHKDLSTDSELDTELRIYQRHLDAALSEVQPSVSAEDRLKYKLLYANFTKSREGSFGLPTPGKKTTMA